MYKARCTQQVWVRVRVRVKRQWSGLPGRERSFGSENSGLPDLFKVRGVWSPLF